MGSSSVEGRSVCGFVGTRMECIKRKLAWSLRKRIPPRWDVVL